MIKKRLANKRGVLAEELLGDLWVYRMTVKTATGETPLAMTYEIEVVILLETSITSHKVYHCKEEANDKG